MQYFQVGEEVILQAPSLPDLNGEYTVSRVVVEGDSLAVDGSKSVVAIKGCGYTYMLDGIKTKFINGIEVYHYFKQSSLRKKHQGGESFEPLMSSIKDGTLEALDG